MELTWAWPGCHSSVKSKSNGEKTHWNVFIVRPGLDPVILQHFTYTFYLDKSQLIVPASRARASPRLDLALDDLPKKVLHYWQGNFMSSGVRKDIAIARVLHGERFGRAGLQPERLKHCRILISVDDGEGQILVVLLCQRTHLLQVRLPLLVVICKVVNEALAQLAHLSDRALQTENDRHSHSCTPPRSASSARR